ncbi:MAG TPA: stage II sporulation protein M [Caulobacteraceae bacterium]|jgi:uncharacterized membrane protein SpoIIM required for sporulation|nr:stage II sporulation protein M [Caulobacteraceae bacterium]
MALALRSRRFRAEREDDWRRLEALLARVEAGKIASLTDDELLALPVVYRATLSSLSVARATSLDASLVAYLEALAARAYVLVYGSRLKPLERAGAFFGRDWPAAVRALWRETAVCAALLIGAAVVGFLLVSRDPSWYGSIIPAALSQGRDPTASTSFLRTVIYDSHHERWLTGFAAFLFQHNAQVSLLAFALGFAFCIPTALLVADNGLTLGALVALYAGRGLGFQIGGWLAIHGATELFATTLAGAAGLHIGWAVIFPGPQTRLAAAAAAGRTAGFVMGGVLVMLGCAAVLEGIGRQVVVDDTARWAIGLTSLILWLGYFYLPRRRGS